MTENQGSATRNPNGSREPEERALRALLTEAHRSDPPAPSFRRLWTRAQGSVSTGRSTLGRRLATVGAVAVVLLALGWVWGLVGRDASPTRPSALDPMALDPMALDPTAPTPAWTSAEAGLDSTASAWAGWRGPLDFLLDTPGRSYLESVPTFAGGTLGDVLQETAHRERRTPDV